jgi:hypothetical protein
MPVRVKKTRQIKNPKQARIAGLFSLEFLMTKWIGAALLAVTLALGNAASMGPAGAGRRAKSTRG